MGGAPTLPGGSRLEIPSEKFPGSGYTKYVIVDMFTKGVQGTKAEDAVTWAAGELKKIYG